MRRTGLRELARESPRPLLAVVHFIAAAMAKLLGSERGFFGKHDRDFIPDRVDPVAGLAFEAGQVGGVLNRRLTDGADENIEQVLRYRHNALREGAEAL